METIQRGVQRGQQLADPKQVLPGIAREVQQTGRKVRHQLGRAGRDVPQTFVDTAPLIPRTPTRTKNPAVKPMLMECCEHDPEILHNFLESVTDEERSIIEQSKDPKHILKIRMRIEEDVDNTAKDLAMDD